MTNDPDEILPSANLRATGYYIAHRWATCPYCGAATLLTALAVGAGHEMRDDESDDWEPVEAHAFSFYIAAVSAPVHRQLRKQAPNFRFVSDKTTGHAGWANHCEHCGLAVDDDLLHAEPGGHGFVPCSENQAASVYLIEVDEPFEALAAGYALEPEFFGFMQHI